VKQLLLVIFICITTVIIAQKNNDDKLAMQFYERKEYDKAVVYFDKLYDRNPDAFFTYYYKCLVETKDYSKAEKVLKKQIKRNETAYQLYVWLGKLYKLQNNTDKEKEQYNKAIKELIPLQNYVFVLAHAFEEAVFLSLMGGIIGLLLIYILTLVADGAIDMDISLTRSNIILGLTTSVLIGIISGFIPAYGASQLDPVEAIRTN
jgi:tetratricopeptide (TPR) repeat protein